MCLKIVRFRGPVILPGSPPLGLHGGMRDFWGARAGEAPAGRGPILPQLTEAAWGVQNHAPNNSSPCTAQSDAPEGT